MGVDFVCYIRTVERQRELRCLSLPMRRWFLTKLAAEQKEARDSAGQRKCAIMAHFRCPALSPRCPALSPRCPALPPPLPLRIFAAFAHFRCLCAFSLPLRIFATFAHFRCLCAFSLPHARFLYSSRAAFAHFRCLCAFSLPHARFLYSPPRFLAHFRYLLSILASQEDIQIPKAFLLCFAQYFQVFSGIF